MVLTRAIAERAATTAVHPADGAVKGPVAVILRTEAVVELLVAVVAYRSFGGGWWLFAALFLLPDLSLLGYLINRRVGAWTYNLGHAYLSPALVGLTGFAGSQPTLYAVALSWVAHIAFDRAMGFGLKYSVAFGATHLGGRHFTAV